MHYTYVCHCCSDSRGILGGLWGRTGRTRSGRSLPTHLHRTARLGATQASGVPGVPPGDADRAAGEEQPQREQKLTALCRLTPSVSPDAPGVPQGEALETVTTAAVCLFSTQTQLADQVPPLGHLPRILSALNHKNNSVPKSAIRLIHVLSDNEVRCGHRRLSSAFRILTRHTNTCVGSRIHIEDNQIVPDPP